MNARDAQIRRRMLNLARLRAERQQDGYVPASLYADQAKDDDGVAVESDEHAERLLNDLVEWGLLEEPRDPHHQAGTKREFRHRRFRITKKGWALWMGDIPPVPGVADDRLEAN